MTTTPPSQPEPGADNDPYRILGVARDASDDEVRAAYRRLVRVHHPDRHVAASPEEQALHERRMAEVSGAWRLLNDPAALARHERRQTAAQDADASPGASVTPHGAEQHPQGAGRDHRQSDQFPFDVDGHRRWGQPTSAPPSGVPGHVAAAPARRRRSLGSWVFMALALMVFAGGAWVAFTDEGAVFLDDLTTTLADAGADNVPEVDGRGNDRIVGFEDGDAGLAAATIGTCHNALPASAGQATELEQVDCAQPHDQEVIAIVTLSEASDDPWPGRGAVEQLARAACDIEFLEIIGAPSTAADEWDTITTLPTPESWARGLRLAVCRVARANGAPMEGSIIAGTSPLVTPSPQDSAS